MQLDRFIHLDLSSCSLQTHGKWSVVIKSFSSVEHSKHFTARLNAFHTFTHTFIQWLSSSQHLAHGHLDTQKGGTGMELPTFWLDPEIN